MRTLEDIALNAYEHNLLLALVISSSLEKRIMVLNRNLPALERFTPKDLDPNVARAVHNLSSRVDEAKRLIDSHPIESTKEFILSLERRCREYSAMIEYFDKLVFYISNSILLNREKITYDPKFISTATQLKDSFTKMLKPLLSPRDSCSYNGYTDYILSQLGEAKSPEDTRVAEAREEAAAIATPVEVGEATKSEEISSSRYSEIRAKRRRLAKMP